VNHGERQWRAVVNAVMNVIVLQNTWNFWQAKRVQLSQHWLNRGASQYLWNTDNCRCSRNPPELRFRLSIDVRRPFVAN
jgi:hypothetical protein